MCLFFGKCDKIIVVICKEVVGGNMVNCCIVNWFIVQFE